ncbi:MAG: DivIVA domain-containing protein [Candidatus Krumholzibacteriales bacterium]
MRITPLDIRKQEFKRGMRGLDTDEVYAFLNTVAQEYENILNDNKQLREHIVDLRERLKEFKNMENNLRDTLLTAEKLTAEARENARHEAALIIKEAEIEAEKASQRVRAEAERLRNEVLELRKQKENYIVRFKTLIDTHRQMILNSESDFAYSEAEMENRNYESDHRPDENDPHHRMSRERITEEFSHEPAEDKTPRPQQPAEESSPEMNDDPPAEAGIPEGNEPGDRAEKAPESGPEVKEQTGGPEEQPEDSVDQWVDAVSPAEEDSTSPQPEKGADKWKGYQVDRGETDWSKYEVSTPDEQPEDASQADELNDALSGLQESSSEPEKADHSQEKDQQADRQAQPEEDAPAPEEDAEDRQDENSWSMEEFRKNLTNITDDN